MLKKISLTSLLFFNLVFCAIGDIFSLKLWLDAESGVGISNGLEITNWINKADNSMIADVNDLAKLPEIQSNGLNGHNTILFQIGDTMEIANYTNLAFTNTFSVYLVGKFLSLPAANDNAHMLFGYKRSTGAHLGWNLAYDRTTTKLSFFQSAGAWYFKKFDTVSIGSWLLIEVKVTNQLAVARIDGILQSVPGLTDATFAGTNSFTLFPGGNFGNISMEVAEILLFNDELAPSNRYQVYDYLMTKYFSGPDLITITPTNGSVVSHDVVPEFDFFTSGLYDFAISNITLLENNLSRPLTWSNNGNKVFFKITNRGFRINSKIHIINNSYFITTNGKFIIPLSTTFSIQPDTVNINGVDGISLWFDATTNIVLNIEDSTNNITNWTGRSTYQVKWGSTSPGIVLPDFVNNAINGHPAAHFEMFSQMDGIGISSFAFTDNFAILLIAKINTPFPTGGNEARSLLGFKDWESWNLGIFRSESRPTFHQKNPPWFVNKYGENNSLITNQWSSLLLTGSNGQFSVYQNGQLLGTYDDITNINVPSDKFVICSTNNTVGKLSMDMSELIIFDHPISDNQRIALENYIIKKYNPYFITNVIAPNIIINEPIVFTCTFAYSNDNHLDFGNLANLFGVDYIYTLSTAGYTSQSVAVKYIDSKTVEVSFDLKKASTGEYTFMVDTGLNVFTWDKTFRVISSYAEVKINGIQLVMNIKNDIPFSINLPWFNGKGTICIFLCDSTGRKRSLVHETLGAGGDIISTIIKAKEMFIGLGYLVVEIDARNDSNIKKVFQVVFAK